MIAAAAALGSLLHAIELRARPIDALVQAVDAFLQRGDLTFQIVLSRVNGRPLAFGDLCR